MSKLLTVFGATGQQGGALIDYILERPEISRLFKLRGITRDASKPIALALKERGVEIVTADLNIPSSLNAAIDGSHTVFAVTNFWDKGSAAVEISQGKAVADACIVAQVTHIIWSSLPNVTRMTSGAITAAEHFDSKAEVEAYIRTLEIKSSFFMPGWFMQNHLAFMKPQRDADETYTFSQPWKSDTRVPLIDIRDTGKFIAPALLRSDLYNGKNFTCATAFYTAIEMVDAWTKVTGIQVKFQSTGEGAAFSVLSEEQKHQLKKAHGLITNWSYFGPSGNEDLKWTLEQLTEKPRSWEEFVQDNQPWFEGL